MQGDIFNYLIVESKGLTVVAVLSAALHQTHRTLELVLQKGWKVNEGLAGYRPLDWAVLLNDQTSVDLIRRAGGKCSPGFSTDLPQRTTVAHQVAVRETRSMTSRATTSSSTAPEVRCRNPTSRSTKYRNPPVLEAWFTTRNQSAPIDVTFTLIEKLVGLGQDINSTDETGRTLLYHVIMTRNYPYMETIRQLLLLGADPNISPHDKSSSLLILAMKSGLTDIVNELVWVNIDVEAQMAPPTQSECMSINYKLLVAASYSTHGLLRVFEDRGYYDKYLESYRQSLPEPLTILCRKRLRQECGLSIHTFLQSQKLPTQIDDFLLLNDVIIRK
jgi:hypothetical protein